MTKPKRHKDAIQIMEFLRRLPINLADGDWKQAEEFIDAAVRHAAKGK